MPANSVSLTSAEKKEIAKTVLTARHGHKWTLKQAAEACGVSVSQFSNIELGRNLPSLSTYITLCRVLGLGVPVMLSK